MLWFLFEYSNDSLSDEFFVGFEVGVRDRSESLLSRIRRVVVVRVFLEVETSAVVL